MRIDLDVLKKRAEIAWESLRACALCPRKCGVDRLAGKIGYCGSHGRWGNGEPEPDCVYFSSAGPHFGEETCLVGRGGSGTVFFSGCNLSCMFCQNSEISQGGEGMWVPISRLASIFLSLQNRGCHNLNIVTPTHFVAHLLRALVTATEIGFRLPLVYNCGGYESVETIQLLDGIVDIYMPDFKYTDPKIAEELSDAPDYPRYAKAALKAMHRQVGDLRADGPAGTATRGLLIRHLVLPENLAGTEEAMRFIAEEISIETYVNIMDQYRPCHRAWRRPALSRSITAEEYQAAVDAAVRYGLHRGFPRKRSYSALW
jgi:putative pyruvate formate lyase activating enzyme